MSLGVGVRGGNPLAAMACLTCLALGLALWVRLAAMANDEVKIGYLGLERSEQEPLSLLDPVLTDDGLQGARVAIDDNNTTGQFMGQDYLLDEIIVPRDGDVAAAFRQLLDNGADWIVSGLPAEQLRQVMLLPEAQGGVTIFNAGAPDDALRNEECRENLFHTTPSRAMLTDALAQFLVFKRWNRWALVVGNTEVDELRAQALKKSAERFGGNIVGELQWPHTAMARRAEGGFHAIQREVPVFLQDLPDHDILIIVDETDYFGEYFPYQTWQPRPVGGTQGLIATAWHRAHESWGANQMQNRFEAKAGRWMTPRDFAAWIAVRAIGEGATRTQSVAPDDVLDYMLSERFELAAYLGYPVTFRTWDRQLRQPVLVTGPRMVASVSPQEGFLHPRTPLDSLGDDEPESACRTQ
jgi:ABC transporter substrate binding protein (PQQ-dependent alcohol dehydrogenase system)